MSQPRIPSAIHHDFQTIERYVSATFAGYERALVALIPTLEEPRVADPRRAFERLRFLVETLGGFAIGAAVGTVARMTRVGFGEEVRGRVARLLGRIVRDGTRAAAVTELESPARFLRDPDRPLLDALGTRLLARLRRSIPETLTHVSAIHAEIMRSTPARLPEFAGVLDRFTADDAPSLAFSDQLVSGWQCYVAVVGERRLARPPDAKDAVTEQTLWRTWTRRLAGPPALEAPMQDDIVAQGFLQRIG